jgi:hypothetical protein
VQWRFFAKRLCAIGPTTQRGQYYAPSGVLRDENFGWHKRNTRWAVETDSEEHRAMQRVLSKISPLKNPPIGIPPS